jgi:hypothetical protein
MMCTVQLSQVSNCPHYISRVLNMAIYGFNYIIITCSNALGICVTWPSNSKFMVAFPTHQLNHHTIHICQHKTAGANHWSSIFPVGFVFQAINSHKNFGWYHSHNWGLFRICILNSCISFPYDISNDKSFCLTHTLLIMVMHAMNVINVNYEGTKKSVWNPCNWGDHLYHNFLSWTKRLSLQVE